jgi:hypothetical protein
MEGFMMERILKHGIFQVYIIYWNRGLGLEQETKKNPHGTRVFPRPKPLRISQ